MFGCTWIIFIKNYVWCVTQRRQDINISWVSIWIYYINTWVIALWSSALFSVFFVAQEMIGKKNFYIYIYIVSLMSKYYLFRNLCVMAIINIYSSIYKVETIHKNAVLERYIFIILIVNVMWFSNTFSTQLSLRGAYLLTAQKSRTHWNCSVSRQQYVARRLCGWQPFTMSSLSAVIRVTSNY